PIVAVSRPALLLSSSRKEACTGHVEPEGSTRTANLTVSLALPPIRRAPTASVTTPSTSEPAGMASAPSRRRSATRRARKLSPTELALLARPFVNSTSNDVPAGTVTGTGGCRSQDLGSGMGAGAGAGSPATPRDAPGPPAAADAADPDPGAGPASASGPAGAPASF